MKKIFYLTLLFFILARPVHAYIDPGTGSYLFQILIAGGIGALLFMKDIVRKIKEIFNIKSKKKNENE
jgi:hypothetical protein